LSKRERKGDVLTPQFSAATLCEIVIGYHFNIRLGSTPF
jgi:hypothetical protein